MKRALCTATSCVGPPSLDDKETRLNQRSCPLVAEGSESCSARLTWTARA
jgi:hypothetical protein